MTEEKKVPAKKPAAKKANPALEDIKYLEGMLARVDKEIEKVNKTDIKEGLNRLNSRRLTIFGLIKQIKQA